MACVYYAWYAVSDAGASHVKRRRHRHHNLPEKPSTSLHIGAVIWWQSETHTKPAIKVTHHVIGKNDFIEPIIRGCIARIMISMCFAETQSWQALKCQAYNQKINQVTLGRLYSFTSTNFINLDGCGTIPCTPAVHINQTSLTVGTFTCPWLVAGWYMASLQSLRPHSPPQLWSTYESVRVLHTNLVISCDVPEMAEKSTWETPVL